MIRIRLLILILFLHGCAATPAIYTMPPAEVEAARSDIHTVGVVLRPSPGEQVVAMPARGAGEGLVRGAAIGAALPAVVGFVSPVPGGAALGVVLAPVGLVAGGVYGAVAALPPEVIDTAEQVLQQAVDRQDRDSLLELFQNEVQRLGNERTVHLFLPVDAQDAETLERNAFAPEACTVPPIDTLLEIRIERAGLIGAYRINPPVDVFVQMSARLIRIRDDQELLHEIVVCKSDEEKTLMEWSADGGHAFVEEFKGCAPELAEKIVDDLFLLYPGAIERN